MISSGIAMAYNARATTRSHRCQSVACPPLSVMAVRLSQKGARLAERLAVSPPEPRRRGTMAALTIVGLGPGDPGLLTLAAREALARARLVILRTARHPGVEALPAGPVYRSCDDLYDTLQLRRRLRRDRCSRAGSSARRGRRGLCGAGCSAGCRGNRAGAARTRGRSRA